MNTARCRCNISCESRAFYKHYELLSLLTCIANSNERWQRIAIWKPLDVAPVAAGCFWTNLYRNVTFGLSVKILTSRVDLATTMPYKKAIWRLDDVFRVQFTVQVENYVIIFMSDL